MLNNATFMIGGRANKVPPWRLSRGLADHTINPPLPRLAQFSHTPAMYLPDVVDLQPPLAELPDDLGPEQIPNVTKGISQVLEMCEAAGLDSQGFGCGMSVPPLDLER